jgi:hypothetical protein
MEVSVLGGVMVSMLATGSKVHGFRPGRGDGFLKAIQNPQHTFLPRRSNAGVVRL